MSYLTVPFRGVVLFVFVGYPVVLVCLGDLKQGGESITNKSVVEGRTTPYPKTTVNGESFIDFNVGKSGTDSVHKHDTFSI